MPDHWTSDQPLVATSTYAERIQWALTRERITRAQATHALGEPLDPVDPLTVHANLDRLGIPRVVTTPRAN